MNEDVKKVPVFSDARCGTCRQVIPDDKLMKSKLDEKRLSVFCGICQRFLFIYDPAAAQELTEMINKDKEVKNS